MDVGARTAEGHTALMTAVCSGQVACVRLLVQVEGIDLYTVDGEGATLDMVPTKHPHSSLPEEVRQTMLQGSPKALRIVQLARERKLLQEEKRRLEEYKVLQQQNRKDLKRLEKVVEERKKNEVEKGMEEGINKIETVGGTGKNAKNKRRKERKRAAKKESSKEVGNDEKAVHLEKENVKKLLEGKLKEVEKEEELAQLIVKEKSLKLVDIGNSIDNIGIDLSDLDQKLEDIDDHIKKLEEKRLVVAHNKERKMESRKEKECERKLLLSEIEEVKINKEKVAKHLQGEIEELKYKLDDKVSTKQPTEKVNPDNSMLVEFVERQVAALEEELECPICMEVLTTSPLYKCADDHLICPGCRPKVARCPQCRETYPRGEFTRFRGAERQAERLVKLREERRQILENGSV